MPQNYLLLHYAIKRYLAFPSPTIIFDVSEGQNSAIWNKIKVLIHTINKIYRQGGK